MLKLVIHETTTTIVIKPVVAHHFFSSIGSPTGAAMPVLL